MIPFAPASPAHLCASTFHSMERPVKPGRWIEAAEWRNSGVLCTVSGSAGGIRGRNPALRALHSIRTPGGGRLSSGTKKSGASGASGSTR